VPKNRPKAEALRPFRNTPASYDEEILSPPQKTELKDHGLSAVCQGVLNPSTAIGETVDGQKAKSSDVTKE
jgi:hypothetical protein